MRSVLIDCGKIAMWKGNPKPRSTFKLDFNELGGELRNPHQVDCFACMYLEIMVISTIRLPHPHSSDTNGVTSWHPIIFLRPSPSVGTDGCFIVDILNFNQ